MAYYRIYLVDGDSKITSGYWVEASDDEAALAIVLDDQERTHDCELWRGARIVGKVPKPFRRVPRSALQSDGTPNLPMD